VHFTFSTDAAFAFEKPRLAREQVLGRALRSGAVGTGSAPAGLQELLERPECPDVA